MSTELAVRDGYTLDEIKSISSAFAQSGYFKDATDVAKAFTKILAGRELGIGPMTAMTQIHVIQGKTTMSATLVGAKIKEGGRYDYRVRALSDERCVLVFSERGQEVGESSFSMDDAKTAGLLGNATWKKFPRNMLLSRALTNGARWYCPDVFGGAVYTPDELGAEVDGETGEVVDGEIVDEKPKPRSRRKAKDSPAPPEGSAPAPDSADRESGPSSPATEQEAAAASPEQGAEEGDGEAGEITDEERKTLLAPVVKAARERGLGPDDYARLVREATGTNSTTGATLKQVEALRDALERFGVEAVEGEASEVSE